MKDISAIYAKLVVYETCHSGEDPPDNEYAIPSTLLHNLLYETYSRGAICAVGFQGLIKLRSYHLWGDEFWWRLSQGWSVYNSQSYAKELVYDAFSTYDGFDTYSYRGNHAITY